MRSKVVREKGDWGLHKNLTLVYIYIPLLYMFPTKIVGKIGLRFGCGIEHIYTTCFGLLPDSHRNFDCVILVQFCICCEYLVGFSLRRASMFYYVLICKDTFWYVWVLEMFQISVCKVFCFCFFKNLYCLTTRRKLKNK